MGNTGTIIKNQTPYPISYVCSHQVAPYTAKGHGTVEPHSEVTVWHEGLPSFIYLKHGRGRSEEECFYNYDVHWWYNAINNWTFTIRERGSDRSELELGCNSGENDYKTFPNYGKIEADRLEKEEEEERRRQQQLERERQIQEEIETETKALEQVQERRNQSLEIRNDVQNQRIAVKHNGSFFHYDESKHIEEKFNQLLIKYNIQENEHMQFRNISERMWALQILLITEYAKKDNLPFYCLQNVDENIGGESLSLTETFNVFEIVAKLILEDSNKRKDKHKVGEDVKSYFLFCIVEKLCKENRTLAVKILKQIIHTLSKPSQEYICTIVYNEIWSLAEATQFYFAVQSQEHVEEILHLVQTYQLPVHDAVEALKQPSPKHYLVKKTYEKDKDVKTLVREMEALQYPESILNILEKVLQEVTDRLKNDQIEDQGKSVNEEVIRSIKDTDFKSPEMLVDVLVHLAKAVKEATSDLENNIRGYFPRITQLASLLVLLQPNEPDCKGRLLEIATGEGKSCIVAMFAVMQAIRGNKVDIITSSSVLARRDQEEWEKLYEMFGIECSVIPPRGLDKCTDVRERDKLIHDAYSAHVVYGIVEDFAADILRQEFEKKQTRGSRKFDIAIVDEVDYMTLDNGVQVTFLSHEVTGLRHLDQVLTAIWAKVCTCQRIVEAETGEILWMSGIQFFHKLAISAVFGKETPEHCGPTDILMCGVEMGLVSEEDLQIVTAENNSPESISKNTNLENLIRKFGPSQQKDLLTVFGKYLNDEVNFKFYELKDGKACFWEDSGVSEEKESISVLLMDHGLACLLTTEKDLIDATAEELKSLVTYSDSDKLRDGKILPKGESKETQPDNDELQHGIIIPKHLKEYTEGCLHVFVENALRALVMEKEREYTIDCRDLSDSPESHSIIPIDFISTGVLEKNKRWGDGLQQFLEVKHQLALSPLSTVTNFMSNFHFFQKYSQGGGISGVSGTLGDENDCAFLRKHYQTDSYVMPTHCVTKRLELPAIQVGGGREFWITEICKCVKSRISANTQMKGQAALVICEDVITAEEIKENLLEQNVDTNKITMYTRSDKDNVEMKTFDSGDIILATNLGGRGTDIKVTNEVNLSGGLCVILTHFPANMRVEKQIFGRTSRKGNPGMVQMILNSQDMAPLYQNQPVEIMGRRRATYEKERILEMEQNELLEVNIKHELFTLFCSFLEEFSKKYSEKEINGACCVIKFDYKIALNALKETWAMWLTLHEKDINNHTEVEGLKDGLKLVLNQRATDILQGKSENVYDFVKLAIDRTHLHIRDKENDHGALEYWEKVASTDPVYRAISLYNRAFITINMRKEGYINKSMELLKEAKESLEIYILEAFNTNTFGKIADCGRFENHDKNTNFTLQMETRMNLLKTWVDGIGESLSKLESLKKEKKKARTKECSIFSLSSSSGKVASDEVSILYDCGLSLIFEVEEKPQFCFSALVCFLLGAAQIFAGVLVCVLTVGVGSSIGVALISEGVSDIISGIIGMVKGTFSWAQWAISKAISIVLSLLSAGSSAFKTAFNEAKVVFKEARTMSSVASAMVQAGKTFCTSAVTNIKTMTIHSVQGFICRTGTKEGIINGVKFTGKKLAKAVVKQSGLLMLQVEIQKGIEAVIKTIFEKSLEDKVKQYVTNNKELEQQLFAFIIERAVPSITLRTQNPNDFKIKVDFEKKIKNIINEACALVTSEAFNSNFYMKNIISALEPASKLIVKVLKEETLNGKQGVKIVTLLAKYSVQLTEILQSLPNEAMTDQLTTTIIKQIPVGSHYPVDERRNIPDVIRLTQELQDLISEIISKEYFHFVSCVIINHANSKWEPRVRKATKEALKDASEELPSNPFSQITFNQVENTGNIPKHSQKIHLETQLDPSVEEVKAHMKTLEEGKHFPTELELRALTNTQLLNGKGIKVTVVGSDDKKLSTSHFPGSVLTSGNIALQVKESSTPGQFSFSLEKEKSFLTDLMSQQKEMCLYEAFHESLGKDKQQTLISLKEEVNKEILAHLDIYLPIIKRDLQRKNVMNLSKNYRVSDHNDMNDTENPRNLV